MLEVCTICSQLCSSLCRTLYRLRSCAAARTVKSMLVHAQNGAKLCRLPSLLGDFGGLQKLELGMITAFRDFFGPLSLLPTLHTLVLQDGEWGQVTPGQPTSCLTVNPEGLTNLTRLELSEFGIHTVLISPALAVLSRLTYLRCDTLPMVRLRLDISLQEFQTGGTDVVFAHDLHHLVHLTDLEIQDTTCLDGTFDACLPNLTSLKLDGAAASNFLLVDIPNLRVCKWVNVTSLTLFGQVPKLQALMLLDSLHLVFGPDELLWGSQMIEGEIDLESFLPRLIHPTLCDMVQLHHLTIDCTLGRAGIPLHAERVIAQSLGTTQVVIDRRADFNDRWCGNWLISDMLNGH